MISVLNLIKEIINLKESNINSIFYLFFLFIFTTFMIRTGNLKRVFGNPRKSKNENFDKSNDLEINIKNKKSRLTISNRTLDCISPSKSPNSGTNNIHINFFNYIFSINFR